MEGSTASLASSVGGDPAYCRSAVLAVYRCRPNEGHRRQPEPASKARRIPARPVERRLRRQVAASRTAVSSNGTARQLAGRPTHAYSPCYARNMCAASRLPTVLTESKCGRPLGLRFHDESDKPLHRRRVQGFDACRTGRQRGDGARYGGRWRAAPLHEWGGRRPGYRC